MKKITVKGVMAYPFLTRLDTKHDDDGLFKVNMVTRQDLHNETAEQLEEFLTAYANSEEAKKANKGKAPKLHPDGLPFSVDEEAGTITFKLKNKTYRRKETKELFSMPMSFFDKDKNALGTVKVDDGEVLVSAEVPNVGGGTKAVVSVEVKPWIVSGKAGLSLRPTAFKLVEVVEFTGTGAADFEDDEDEDSFDVPNVSSGKSAPAAMAGDDDDENF